jgi:hypothetical protein
MRRDGVSGSEMLCLEASGLLNTGIGWWMRDGDLLTV